MHGLFLHADDVLRRRWTAQANRQRLAPLVGLVVVFGTLYGAAMGSFGSILGAGWLQIIYSGAKVSILLLATFALSLPSFYVVNSLLGLRHDFAESIRALVATQAGLSVILASLAPFTLLWYASVDGYNDAILFNAGMFAVASLSAQGVLRVLPTVDPPQSSPPLDAPGLAAGLCVCWHSNGLDSAPIRGRPSKSRAILSRGLVGQRLSGCWPNGVAGTPLVTERLYQGPFS